MTNEREALQRHLETGLNRYAILTGAVELLLTVLETPALQQAVSHVLSGGASDIAWKELARFAPVDGREVIWWSAPVEEVTPHKNTLIAWLVGETINWFVASQDFYMSEILRHRFGTEVASGNAWDQIEGTTGIRLLGLPHGAYVYAAIQERHKVEHNRSVVDERFIKRLAAKGILHSYAAGAQIEKGHFDVTRSFASFEEFTTSLDAEVERMLASRAGTSGP